MDLIVVGAGWAGERHVLAVKALEREGRDAHVAALVDVDADHLAAQAAAWGVGATYRDLSLALSAHPDAGAVVLATPHNRHREGTEQAARAGRHVLVEKPMALTLEDADAMIAACDAAGVTLMVAESARFHRPTMAVREALDAGMIGQVLSGRLNSIGRGRHTYQYPGRRAWLAEPDQGGTGIWMLNGIHQMSVARMLFGEVMSIYAREVRSAQFQSPLEATVVALLEFESGATITMTVSAELHGYKRFGDIVVFGADGTLAVNRREGSPLEIYTEGATEPEIVACADGERSGAPDHFVRQMAEFLAAVAEKRPPSTDGPSERATLAAILAGYESIRTGRPMTPESSGDMRCDS